MLGVKKTKLVYSLGDFFFFPNILPNPCLNNASFLLFPGLPEYCTWSAHVCLAYYVNVCLKLPFLWFYSTSSGITGISTTYKCSITCLESFHSWPNPLSSFILGCIHCVPAWYLTWTGFRFRDHGWWAKEARNLFCWTSCLGKEWWDLRWGE